MTYEVALALKELGFNEPCMKHVQGNTFDVVSTSVNECVPVLADNFNAKTDCVSLPLWQQVTDYFRTKHDIVIELTRFEHRDTIVEWVYIIEKWDGNVIVEYHECEHFKTHEECREASILMAIELIKSQDEQR